MSSSAYYLLNAASIINIYDINYYKRNQYSTYLGNPLHSISAMIDMICQLMDRSGLILPLRNNIIPSHTLVRNNIFNSHSPRRILIWNVFTFHSRPSALEAVFCWVLESAPQVPITWPFLIRLGRRTPSWANNKRDNPTRLLRFFVRCVTCDVVAPLGLRGTVTCWFCKDDFYWWGAYSA